MQQTKALATRVIKGYGWRPSRPDHRDFKYARIMPRIALPPRVDLRPNCPPVYDQGQLGSCTGNGVGACWQFALMRERKFAPLPSRLLIYYCERVIEGTVDQDNGAEIRDGLQVLAKTGCCDEALWPYDIAKFAEMPSSAAFIASAQHEATQYWSVNQSLNDLKTCLASGFPVVFGFSVYESFESQQVAETGIVYRPAPSEQMVGGHCVVLVGYDDASQRFIVRNSWGKDWGQAGYFTMSYAYVTSPDLANDFWTVRAVV